MYVWYTGRGDLLRVDYRVLFGRPMRDEDRQYVCDSQSHLHIHGRISRHVLSRGPGRR